ncbi:MAG: AMP-binding protein [Clostridiales bacterium]|nr:AMP-binding protein [Clostridiales bacterium]
MKFYDRILLELKTQPHTMQTVYRYAYSFTDEVAFEYSRNLVIHKITYGESRRNILRLCGFLAGQIAPGGIAALIMPNSPLWVECFWAVLMAGGKIMPLSADMTDGMIRKCLADSGCTLILGDHAAEGCRTITAAELEKCSPGGAPEKEPEEGWGDEIILSTSATTGEPALYSYTGKEICIQILNSRCVLDNCRDVSRFWKKQFRQLAFLPFSHIFGLTACYLWFAVFGRTFVFLEDYTPTTIMRTCRLHHVTHVFAIPLLWDSLARGIRAEAEKTGRTEKLEKGIRLSLAIQDLCPALGRALVPVIMKSVQEKTLGNSIRFCISGGGKCGRETGRMINGCGYHLENGYGMTEIGIACVTLKKKAGQRTCKTVGKLFPSLTCEIDGQQHLLVKGGSCYAARYAEGRRTERDADAWFDTGDCFSRDEEGELTVLGRSDDTINGANGQRINPESVESEISVEYPCCIVSCAGGQLTLLAQVPSEACLSSRRRQSIVSAVTSAVDRLPLPIRPRRVLFTYDTIPVSLSHKFRRKQIAELIENGELPVMDSESFLSPGGKQEDNAELLSVAAEVAAIMQKTLNLSRAVRPEEDFFADLNGDSLSYIEYLNSVENRYQIVINKETTAGCTTPVSTARVLSGLAEQGRAGE